GPRGDGADSKMISRLCAHLSSSKRVQQTFQVAEAPISCHLVSLSGFIRETQQTGKFAVHFSIDVTAANEAEGKEDQTAGQIARQQRIKSPGIARRRCPES